MEFHTKTGQAQKDAIVTQVEELSMNAWPAFQTVIVDGWILRFADGYTRRANSINPLYGSDLDLEEKIDTCAQFYRRKGLPVTFKLTPASLAMKLDQTLAERGYLVESRTSVQLLDLTLWEAESSKDDHFQRMALDDWLVIHSRMRDLDEPKRSIHGRMLQLILQDKCFGCISFAGEPVSCGLGVVQHGFMGLFDVVTDTLHRQQGHGERLVRDLLSWGKSIGATQAYLQVMLNNDPALRLYEKLGFKEAYQYWYRISTSVTDRSTLYQIDMR